MNNIRRSIRFPAEPKDIAWVEVQPAEGHSEFQAQVAALIINESFTGCALILSTVSLNGHTLEENTFIKVKVGPLDPMLSEIIWIKPIDTEVIKVGLKYHPAK